jgi:hypothetical protein
MIYFLLPLLRLAFHLHLLVYLLWVNNKVYFEEL